MATGSGKTYTAVSFVYRLIKHAGARRVLFMIDQRNLGLQALEQARARRRRKLLGQPPAQQGAVADRRGGLVDPGQPDRFYTVFTRDDGVDLAGLWRGGDHGDETQALRVSLALPPGWKAPTIDIPNPIDVGDEFEKNARRAPNIIRDWRRKGIFVGAARDVRIAHNRIWDVPRYAISCKSQGEERL